MEPEKALLAKSTRRRIRAGENGIALITTLLLLMLMTGLVVAMVLALNSDMLINGYYRNFRSGFYAADSGLAIVRQDMANQLLATLPASFDPATQPIPDTAAATAIAYLRTTYGGSGYKSITAGQTSPWPATFYLDPTVDPVGPDPKYASLTVAKPCEVTNADVGGTCITPCPTGCKTAATTPTKYTYYYKYHLLVYGRSLGVQKTTLEESGSVTITVPVTLAGGTNMSFAAWGMFIDASPLCDGNTLVPGTISGPVFTNQAWNFSDDGQYIFTDSVGSASSQAGYQFNKLGGHPCDKLANVKDTQSGDTIAPTFKTPPKWGQPKVKLPTNDFNQQRAVLDGIGTAGQPTDADRNASLKNASGQIYNKSGENSGVFLPYSVDSTTGATTFTGGGILVEGNADVKLSTSGSTAQVYEITQGSKKTTITIDPGPKGTNTTVFTTDGKSVTIAGVPQQIDPLTKAVVGPATMLYVDGSITSLTGPGVGQAAVQDGIALSITAKSDITITGDVLYKTEPVTTTQNQKGPDGKVYPDADSLIDGNDKGQALGIFTAAGNIQLKNLQSSPNLQIDASLATISATGNGALVNTGSAITKLTIVGGRIQNTMQNINSTTRNVYFDKRYANGLAPPWFPSTTLEPDGSLAPSAPTSTFQRLQWVNQTAYQ